MVLFSYSSSPHKDYTIKVYRRRMTDKKKKNNNFDNAQMLYLKNEFLIRLRSIWKYSVNRWCFNWTSKRENRPWRKKNWNVTHNTPMFCHMTMLHFCQTIYVTKKSRLFLFSAIQKCINAKICVFWVFN